MDIVSQVIKVVPEIEVAFEGYFSGVPKWQLILGTVSVTAGVLCLHDVVKNTDDYVEEFKSFIFQNLRKVPSIKKEIEAELIKSRDAIKETIYMPSEREMDAFLELPNTGQSEKEVLELTAQNLKLGKFEWLNGKVSGGVNSGNDTNFNDLLKEIYRIFALSNPLHADLFPGVRKMEAEIVRMTANLFHGDENTVGCVTTGGTESLTLMMKAYRDMAREQRGIRHPEVVAAVTVHAAIDKAADYLGIKFRKVKVDSVTQKVDLTALSKAINSNTILLVASAPEYSHGIIDDVEEMSKIAIKKGLALHVDCCLGGFILPFMEAAGYPISPFDFSVPGVTSISADAHKYGNCPKGSSILLYRNKEYIHYQYFSVPDWPGGIYATPTIPGSRAGVNTSVCWAALMYHGKNGYVKITRSIISIARELKTEIRKIPGLFVFGDPSASIVSFGSDEVNIMKVADVMCEYGWHLQPLQNPPGIHIFLTSLHIRDDIVEELVTDLKKAMEIVRKSPGEATAGLAKLYGMMNSLPDKTLVRDGANVYLDVYYTSAKSDF